RRSPSRRNRIAVRRRRFPHPGGGEGPDGRARLPAVWSLSGARRLGSSLTKGGAASRSELSASPSCRGKGGRLLIRHCGLSIADCPLLIRHCRLTIGDCRLPIADCLLLIACRLWGRPSLVALTPRLRKNRRPHRRRSALPELE